jgi:hypothetical protein
MKSTVRKKKASHYHTLSRGSGALKRPKAKIYQGAALAYYGLATETASSEQKRGGFNVTKAKS